MSQERLQKILARGGFASRRAAEGLITGGRVRVNGKVVTELGQKADPRVDKIEVDGKRVIAEALHYLVLHKPRGVVSTLSDPEGRPTVKELLRGIDARIYPVGRLDFATSGALFFTNDGDFTDALLHPRKSVPKKYIVKVVGEMTPADVERWKTGVRLDDGITKKAEVGSVRHEDGKTWFELTISEGRNQQIRRMGEATRFRVMRLARLEFAGISTAGLRPGQWRSLTRDELVRLQKEFGVPKKLPSPDTLASPEANPRARSKATRGAKPVERYESGDRRPQRGEGPARPRRVPGPIPAPRSRDDARAGGTVGGAGGAAAGGARYGGGAPGRRSTNVRSDWGGGAGRGRNEPAAPTRSAPPGRGGRTRTTGSSGGAGATENDPEGYRMNRGRRGSRG